MSGVTRAKKPLLHGLLVAVCVMGVAGAAAAQEEAAFDCSQAGHLWENATKEELRDPKLHYRSSRLYFSQGADDPLLYIKAARSGELAVHLDPTDAQYHMQLAMAYGQLECYEAAGRAFADAKRLVAGNEKETKLAEEIENNTKFYWSGRFMAGVEKNDEGDLDGAVMAFESAIAVDSTDARAYKNLGVAFHGLERYEDAIVAFESALARDPSDETAKQFYRSTQAFIARQTFAEALSKQGAEAIDELATVMSMYGGIMKQNPPDAEIVEYETMMGEAERAIGENVEDPAVAATHYANAVDHYREAALARHRDMQAAGDVPPTLATDSEYLGQILNCYVATADWDSTMVYGQQLVNLDPRSHRAYGYLGEGLRNTGKQEEALTYFLVMQCLDPQKSEAVENINNHFVGLLSRYQPTDDIVTASIQNLDSPGEIRIAKTGSDTSEAWFFWEDGFVDCYYNGRSAGKVEFTPTVPAADDLGEALTR